MKVKSLDEVYAKRTNRILKVVWGSLYVLSIIYIFINLIAGDLEFRYFFFIIIPTVVFYEFLKRAFYYVTAGDIAPPIV